MWFPGQALNEDIIQMFIAALGNERVKTELSKQIRVEMDNEHTKYRGSMPSYDSLTSGSVNMQARMAASGYDVYGRTVLNSNYNASNNNIYKKMKNKIKYGSVPKDGYRNRGSYEEV